MTSADFIVEHLPGLPPWQQRMVTAWLDDDTRAGYMLVGGRRNGRATMMRRSVEHLARAGKGVHFLAADGVWCVTSQPIGLLWARVR